MFFKIIKLFFVLVVILFVAGCATTVSVRRPIGSGQEIFEGYISEDSVDQFFAKIGEKPVAKLILDSPGGDLISAMRLGKWIFDNNIIVEVKNICLSSCANYLFTAGRKKIISSPGIVAWHGSAEQKNFRSISDRYQKLNQKLAANEKISDNDAKWMSNPELIKYYNYSIRSRPIQRAFFQTVRVSEYITRAGQEPKSAGGLWAFSADDMKAFGVCNVDAPVNYADASYLDQVEKNTSFKIVAQELNLQVRSMLKAEIEKSSFEINLCN